MQYSKYSKGLGFWPIYLSEVMSLQNVLDSDVIDPYEKQQKTLRKVHVSTESTHMVVGWLSPPLILFPLLF